MPSYLNSNLICAQCRFNRLLEAGSNYGPQSAGLGSSSGKEEGIGLAGSSPSSLRKRTTRAKHSQKCSRECECGLHLVQLVKDRVRGR